MRPLSPHLLSRLPISASGALVAFVVIAAGAVLFAAVRAVRTMSAVRLAGAGEVEEAKGDGVEAGLADRLRFGPFFLVERTMPGEVKGRLGSRWLAPYVSVTDRLVGPVDVTIVQWFTPDGKLARELAGPDVGAHPGCVSENVGGGTRIHAVNGDWTFVLPKQDGPVNSSGCTEDSRTFAYTLCPREGEIAANVYVLGKRVGTVGPFPPYDGQGIHLSAEGRLSMPAWKGAGGKGREPGVVVAGLDAEGRFRTDWYGLVGSPVSAPDGAGVLGRGYAEFRRTREAFSFHTKAGEVSSLIVGPNARFAAWLPGEPATALMMTNIGFDHRLHLIEWQKGKRLWAIPDPCPARVPELGLSVAEAGGYLFVGGHEYLKGGGQSSFRSLYAVDAKTGRVAARWAALRFSRTAQGPGRFLRLGERLFLVTDEEFAEVNPDDVAAQRNGWALLKREGVGQ